MRKVFVAVIALAALAAAEPSVQAAQGQRRIVRRRVVVQQQPVNQRVGTYTRGFFTQLMELERRKNNWLFGRR